VRTGHFSKGGQRGLMEEMEEKVHGCCRIS